MRTTLDLPDPLMRRVKIRAASEGRKLKEIISELLEKGLNAPPSQTLPEGELSYRIDPKTGMAISRTLGTPGAKKVSLAESLAIIEQANEEEALSHAGNPR
jgi:plasmid stability protein